MKVIGAQSDIYTTLSFFFITLVVKSRPILVLSNQDQYFLKACLDNFIFLSHVKLFVLQENHQRVNIFFDYAKKTKNTAWSYFLPMLNRQDPFTVHMVGLDLIAFSVFTRKNLRGKKGFAR